MKKLFLDDSRLPPIGFDLVLCVKDAIEWIEKNNGNIEQLSFDNDLGLHTDEGYKLADWLEEQAFLGTIKPINILTIHSQNSSRVANMQLTLANTKKYWGQDFNYAKPCMVGDYPAIKI